MFLQTFSHLSNQMVLATQPVIHNSAINFINPSLYLNLLILNPSAAVISPCLHLNLLQFKSTFTLTSDRQLNENLPRHSLNYRLYIQPFDSSTTLQYAINQSARCPSKFFADQGEIYLGQESRPQSCRRIPSAWETPPNSHKIKENFVQDKSLFPNRGDQTTKKGLQGD